MVETMHVVESSGGPRDRENEGLSAWAHLHGRRSDNFRRREVNASNMQGAIIIWVRWRVANFRIENALFCIHCLYRPRITTNVSVPVKREWFDLERKKKKIVSLYHLSLFFFGRTQCNACYLLRGDWRGAPFPCCNVKATKHQAWCTGCRWLRHACQGFANAVPNKAVDLCLSLVFICKTRNRKECIMNMHTHAHICVSFTDKKVVGLRKRPPAPLSQEKKRKKKNV